LNRWPESLKWLDSGVLIHFFFHQKSASSLIDLILISMLSFSAIFAVLVGQSVSATPAGTTVAKRNEVPVDALTVRVLVIVPRVFKHSLTTKRYYSAA
jgi:hypothetical protein